MKKKFNLWGTITIFILATLLHSLYDFTKLKFLMPISPVNESVWEHMKMIFFAGLIYYLIKVIITKGKKFNNILGYALSLLVMVVTIPMLFYTYSNILGKHLLVVDMVITFLAALFGEYVAFKLKPNKYHNSPSGITVFFSILLIILLATMFIYFTYYPLDTPIFITSLRLIVYF